MFGFIHQRCSSPRRPLAHRNSLALANFRLLNSIVWQYILLEMATKKEETASFVLRFTQKIYKNDQGEPQVQWRGTIRHVQTGDEARFSKYEAAADFVQHKLSELTLQAVEDKSPEEQKGILTKSFELWRKVATTTPKLVIDTIKDPKKQVNQIQEQLQEQIHHVSDAIEQKIEDRLGQKLEIDDWRSATKSDYKNLMKILEQLSSDVANLNKKVEALTKKGK